VVNREAMTGFKYERCLLKHHVRTEAWLTACRQRLVLVRDGRAESDQRRLRYFTFCAENAVDVLMLDVARIVRPSTAGRFDTVFFFNRSEESVGETRKSIPGAIGFPGDFVKVVLVNDPLESDVVAEGVTEDFSSGLPAEPADTKGTREQITRIQTHRDFVASFPFDVMNLDLEGYLFKPSDTIPGDLLRAFRKTFEWQRRPLNEHGRIATAIDAFTLFFTARIGPVNMGSAFDTMLRDSLDSNVARSPDLLGLLEQRTGATGVAALKEANFDAFFRLATPKVLAQLLMETDWYIDPERGIDVYEFERKIEGGGQYRMLHFVMDVRRHVPPQENRAPGASSAVAGAAYAEVVKGLFERPEKKVSAEDIDIPSLEASLAKIDGRRKKYQSG
jgi:hypothetical protein